jgi:hypothetical protein
VAVGRAARSRAVVGEAGASGAVGGTAVAEDGSGVAVGGAGLGVALGTSGVAVAGGAVAVAAGGVAGGTAGATVAVAATSLGVAAGGPQAAVVISRMPRAGMAPRRNQDRNMDHFPFDRPTPLRAGWQCNLCWRGRSLRLRTLLRCVLSLARRTGDPAY